MTVLLVMYYIYIIYSPVLHRAFAVHHTLSSAVLKGSEATAESWTDCHCVLPLFTDHLQISALMHMCFLFVPQEFRPCCRGVGAVSL